MMLHLILYNSVIMAYMFYPEDLNGKLKIFEFDTGSEVKELIGHTDVVSSIRRLPDGKHMVSVSWDGRVKIWDVATGMQVKRFVSS